MKIDSTSVLPTAGLSFSLGVYIYDAE